MLSLVLMLLGQGCGVRHQVRAMGLQDFITRAACGVSRGLDRTQSRASEVTLEVATTVENATEAGVDLEVFALSNTTTLTRATTVTVKLAGDAIPTAQQCSQDSVRAFTMPRLTIDAENGQVIQRVQ